MFDKRKEKKSEEILEEPEVMTGEELREISGTFSNKKGGCPNCHSTSYTPYSDGKRVCSKCLTPYYPED
jgi:hypothetical protein